jgi:CheY-like chemotaxis protein
MGGIAGTPQKRRGLNGRPKENHAETGPQARPHCEVIARIRNVLDKGVSMVWKTTSILLLDRDVSRTELIASKLSHQGLTVTAAHDGIEVRSLLKTKHFDGLILDVLMTRTGHLDLIVWARYRHPTLVIVVTSDLQAPVIEQEALTRGANGIVTKLVDGDKLAEFFSGNVKMPAAETRCVSAARGDMNIIEHLESLMLAGRRSVLDVSADGNRFGRIFLSDGRVLHAVCGALSGEEALYRCLSSREGTISTSPWRDPGRVSIHKPRESLLMEAARRRDQVIE